MRATDASEYVHVRAQAARAVGARERKCHNARVSDLNARILETALSFLGTHEVAGTEHNPLILGWFAAAGSSWVHDDETAWCAAFACGVAVEAGAYNPRTIRAHEWLNIAPEHAEHIDHIDRVTPGDVVVLSRGPNLFHVTFAYVQRRTYLRCIGGNQGNAVRFSNYERDKFIGARRLKRATS